MKRYRIHTRFYPNELSEFEMPDVAVLVSVAQHFPKGITVRYYVPVDQEEDYSPPGG